MVPPEKQSNSRTGRGIDHAEQTYRTMTTTMPVSSCAYALIPSDLHNLNDTTNKRVEEYSMRVEEGSSSWSLEIRMKEDPVTSTREGEGEIQVRR